jgi:hypothetical protein
MGKFLDEDELAHSRITEEAERSTIRDRTEQVNDLYPSFERLGAFRVGPKAGERPRDAVSDSALDADNSANRIGEIGRQRMLGKDSFQHGQQFSFQLGASSV